MRVGLTTGASSHPRVAVVVPVFNQVDRTVAFLEHFRAVRYSAYQLVVVDDGSSDGTAVVVGQRFPEVVVLRGDGNLWWAGATNLGVRHALAGEFDYVLTLNHDTQVHPKFLARLVRTAEANPRTIVGSRIHFLSDPSRTWAIGCRMDWATGTLFHLVEHGRRSNRTSTSGPVPVQTLTGCGTLVPVSCYREAGLYDAVNYPQYHADAEFVLRASRFGYRVLVDPRAVVGNDAANTVADSISRYADFLFSPRSPVYWRPLWAIHRQYCPRRLMLPSLLRHYARFFWYHAPALRACKQFIRRTLAPCPNLHVSARGW